MKDNGAVTSLVVSEEVRRKVINGAADVFTCTAVVENVSCTRIISYKKDLQIGYILK